MWGATVAPFGAGRVVVKAGDAQPVAGRCRARAANMNHTTLPSSGYIMSLSLCIGALLLLLGRRRVLGQLLDKGDEVGLTRDVLLQNLGDL